jgi:hypothetical protein
MKSVWFDMKQRKGKNGNELEGLSYMTLVIKTFHPIAFIPMIFA